MDRLGHNIQKQRHEQRITLKQLSQKTKLSMSFLSQLERGLVNPSVSSLKRIAQAFGISVVDFFKDEEKRQPSFGNLPTVSMRSDGFTYTNDIRLVRANFRKSLALPGSKIFYELLTPDLSRLLEVMHMRVEPGERSGEVIDPPGEKFGLVLKGILEMRIRNEVYQLRAGDSIYFPSHVPIPGSARGMTT